MNIALSFILFFSFLAESESKIEDIYQKNCTEEQRERTLSLSSSTTQADFCFECKQTDTTLNNVEEILKNVDSIPKKCFLAMAIKGNRIFKSFQYNFCKNEQTRRPSKKQYLCMNEDYINSIFKAFNEMSYCFQFDKKKQETLFHLINHESGGILNVRSSTGARCLGQITGDYVETINEIIGNSEYKHYNIWQEVLSRCPEVENFKIEELRYLNCQSMLNPHKCLMYTFFGLQKSYKNIEERLNSEPGFKPKHIGNKEFKSSDSFPSQGDLARRKYENFLSLLPIDRKEMLTVKGRKVNGQKINWLIWDDSEIYGLYREIDWSDETLEIQKVPLFEREEDIKTMFVYWSHNGGHSLSRYTFVEKVEDLKKEAKESCSEGSKKLRCKMRRQIREGKGLSSVLAHEFFREDIFKNYDGDKVRRSEVADYVSKIVESRDIVFDTDNSNNYLKKMLRYHKANETDEETARLFQKDVDENCPKRKDIGVE